MTAHRLRVKAVGFVLAAILLLLSPAPATADLILTGALEFSSDGSGNSFGGQIWNSLGGDGMSNLYVTQANSGTAGTFLNTGDTNPSARINVSLTPGTYTFHIFGDPGADVGNNGLNLFFNSDDINPRISVFAPSDQSPSPPYPAFSANSSTNTVDLQGGTVSGSGNLVYSDGQLSVALTEYRWSNPSVENLDRVFNFGDSSNGTSDFVGHFTLEVSAVPEPSSFALVGFVAGGVWWKRRKRAIATAA